MEKELVLSRNTTRNQGQLDVRQRTNNPRCRVFDWTRALISLAALSRVTFTLYRLDIAACAVPAAAAMAVLLDGLCETATAGLILLAAAGFCLYLLLVPNIRCLVVLRKYLTVETTIWGLYSLQIAASWDFWEQSLNPYFWDEMMLFDSYISVPIVALIVATASHVLLDHPIFQILAVCFSGVGFLSFFFIFAGLNYLLVPVILLSLALGYFQAGRLLQMYRVHVIVYAGRLLRSCKSCFKHMVKF